jgi:hypothetical protein
MKSFRTDLLNSIRAREKRIRDNYITNETHPRNLFGSPDRYNVSIEGINIEGSTIMLTLRAMFAFRCNFLSPQNHCTIHPAVTDSADIRPPHCGYMGSINAKEGEKGFCRIIHSAAESAGNSSAIDAAIDLESRSSEKFFNEGVVTIEQAADGIIEIMREYFLTNAPHLCNSEMPESKPGRNDPCYCGSGNKYKKCHGK